MRAHTKNKVFVRLCALALLGSVAFLASVAIGHRWSNDQTLTVYCAAGLQHRLEPIVKRFEKEQGGRVATRFAGSGQLLATLQLEGRGDLFIGADAFYNRQLEKIGLGKPLVVWFQQHPRLALSADFERRHLVTSVEAMIDELTGDLDSKSIRLSLAKPDHAAIGKVVQESLSAPVYQSLLQQATVTRETVTQVMGDVNSGIADAGFVWDSLPAGSGNAVLLRVPELSKLSSEVVISILGSSDQPAAARSLADFISDQPANQLN